MGVSVVVGVCSLIHLLMNLLLLKWLLKSSKHRYGTNSKIEN